MARTGRTRTTGSGARPKQYKRQAVTYEFKMRVIQFLEKEPMSAAVAHFFPGLSPDKQKLKKRLCYSWKEAREMIEAKCASGQRKHSRHRCLGAGSTLSAQTEEQLVHWVNELRADGVPVTALMLKLQAQELYWGSGGAFGAFTASWAWRKHFLRRHRLSIRRRTREGQTTPEDAAQTAQAFGDAVRKKMDELQITKVYNADQTGAWWFISVWLRQ